MALDKSKLVTELENWLNNSETYDTVLKAMTAFTDAYEIYALDGEDVTGETLDIYFKSEMIDKLVEDTSTSETASQKFEDAIKIFWNTASFKKEIPPAGSILPEVLAIVLVAPASNLIKNGLKPIFEDLDETKTRNQKANEIATVLDTATKTIVTACAGTNPSPPPATISDIGLIT